MTEQERALLLDLAQQSFELTSNRNDILVGTVAALLDIHRLLSEHGVQTNNDAIQRLTVQKDWLDSNVAGQVGAQFLGFLIATLSTGKLDAAQWIRVPPAGTA